MKMVWLLLGGYTTYFRMFRWLDVLHPKVLLLIRFLKHGLFACNLKKIVWYYSTLCIQTTLTDRELNVWWKNVGIQLICGTCRKLGKAWKSMRVLLCDCQDQALEYFPNFLNSLEINQWRIFSQVENYSWSYKHVSSFKLMWLFLFLNQRLYCMVSFEMSYHRV